MGSNGRSQQMHQTRIDLPQDTRIQTIAYLNQSLASTLDLKTQVKQAHWNVKGMDFFQLHTLFDEMAEELEEFIDMVAERVTALGGVAMGTARTAASRSILPEFPFDILNGQDHVAALADRYALYAKEVREAIDSTDDLGDADTADLYTEISRAIDKRLWFLEAHLQNSVETVSLNGAASTTDSQTETSKAKKARAKK